MNFVFTGPDTANAMREAIVAMLDHAMNQSIDQSRRASSVSQVARYAGEQSAFRLMIAQVQSIKLECNNS